MRRRFKRERAPLRGARSGPLALFFLGSSPLSNRSAFLIPAFAIAGAIAGVVVPTPEASAECLVFSIVFVLAMRGARASRPIVRLGCGSAPLAGRATLLAIDMLLVSTHARIPLSPFSLDPACAR